MRFVVEGTDDSGADPSLLPLIVRAHTIRNRLLRDGSLSVEEIAHMRMLVPRT